MSPLMFLRRTLSCYKVSERDTKKDVRRQEKAPFTQQRQVTFHFLEPDFSPQRQARPVGALGRDAGGVGGLACAAGEPPTRLPELRPLSMGGRRGDVYTGRPTRWSGRRPLPRDCPIRDSSQHSLGVPCGGTQVTPNLLSEQQQHGFLCHRASPVGLSAEMEKAGDLRAEDKRVGELPGESGSSNAALHVTVSLKCQFDNERDH